MIFIISLFKFILLIKLFSTTTKLNHSNSRERDGTRNSSGFDVHTCGRGKRKCVQRGRNEKEINREKKQCGRPVARLAGLPAGLAPEPTGTQPGLGRLLDRLWARGARFAARLGRLHGRACTEGKTATVNLGDGGYGEDAERGER